MCLAIAPNQKLNNGYFNRIWRIASSTPLRLFSFCAFIHTLALGGLLVHNMAASAHIDLHVYIFGFTYGILATCWHGFRRNTPLLPHIMDNTLWYTCLWWLVWELLKSKYSLAITGSWLECCYLYQPGFFDSMPERYTYLAKFRYAANKQSTGVLTAV